VVGAEGHAIGTFDGLGDSGLDEGVGGFKAAELGHGIHFWFGETVVTRCKAVE